MGIVKPVRLEARDEAPDQFAMWDCWVYPQRLWKVG
jgi:hypothetical protein